MLGFISRLTLLLFAALLALPAEAQSVSPAPAKKAAKAGARKGKGLQRSLQTVEAPPEPAPPPTPEQMTPNPPQVTYAAGQLTIKANNSLLSEVLNAVRASTGATIEVPPGSASERVMAQIGPAPASEALAALLRGSRFNYVIVGANGDPGVVRSVILTPSRSGGVAASAATLAPPASAQVRPPIGRPPPTVINPDEEMVMPEEHADDIEMTDEAQPPAPPQQTPAMGVQTPGANPPQVKTPEQLLQELQRLQQQQQQQQNPPPGTQPQPPYDDNPE